MYDHQRGQLRHARMSPETGARKTNEKTPKLPQVVVGIKSGISVKCIRGVSYLTQLSDNNSYWINEDLSTQLLNSFLECCTK